MSEFELGTACLVPVLKALILLFEFSSVGSNKGEMFN
jgi:hypothetical protein